MGHLPNPVDGGAPDGHQIQPARLLQEPLGVALHGQVPLLPLQELIDEALRLQRKVNQQEPRRSVGVARWRPKNPRNVLALLLKVENGGAVLWAEKHGCSEVGSWHLSIVPKNHAAWSYTLMPQDCRVSNLLILLYCFVVLVSVCISSSLPY